MKKFIRRRSDKKINAEPGCKILQDAIVKLWNILKKLLKWGNLLTKNRLHQHKEMFLPQIILKITT